MWYNLKENQHRKLRAADNIPSVDEHWTDQRALFLKTDEYF